MGKATVEAYDGSVVCHVRNRQVWIDVTIYYAHFPPAVRQAQLPPSPRQYLRLRRVHMSLKPTGGVLNRAVEICVANSRAAKSCLAQEDAVRETW